MATGRVLLAENSGLAEPFKQQMSAEGSGLTVVSFLDGAQCVAAYARLAYDSTPPVLVILDSQLPYISGAGTALAVRAIERGLGHPSAAILLYTPEPADEVLRGLLGQIGRAVHLQRPKSQTPAEQGRRLYLAVKRLVAQIQGAR